MTKEQIEADFRKTEEEQKQLSQSGMNIANRIQQLEGRKLMLQEMFTELEKPAPTNEESTQVQPQPQG